MKLTKRQLAGILAALRVCQHSIANDSFKGMPHWEGVGKPLTADEIDTLCERINGGSANPWESLA